MRHAPQKPDNTEFIETSKNKITAARRRRNREILKQCKEVCIRHHGLAEIGDGYSIVDTSIYEVTPRTR